MCHHLLCSQVVEILQKLYACGADDLGLNFINELTVRFCHCPKWVGRQAFAFICQVCYLILLGTKCWNGSCVIVSLPVFFNSIDSRVPVLLFFLMVVWLAVGKQTWNGKFNLWSLGAEQVLIQWFLEHLYWHFSLKTYYLRFWIQNDH